MKTKLLLKNIFRQKSKIRSFVQGIANSKVGAFLRKSFRLLHPDHLKGSSNDKSGKYLQNIGPIPSPIDGVLRISVYSSADENLQKKVTTSAPLLHRHIWINGPLYDGMEDNDLRGFLDGRFKFSWNQPGQIHVRLGRRKRNPVLGELELFRVLQRWDGLHLPRGSTVQNARLEMQVENGARRDLDVCIYNVHKDWNPGDGGIEKNNISTPAVGEVWWNEVGHKEESWGLPGAGLASDSHPNADTPVTPLAIAHYHQGDQKIIFESNRLTSYINERISRGSPLLFLLKLTDYFEDIPGSRIDIYSGNHGDNHNSERRPRLILEWQGPAEVTSIEHDILLEHGRSITLPRFEEADIQGIAISFFANNNSEQPTFSIRGKDESNISDWNTIYFPQKIDLSWFEIRIDAFIKPIQLGKPFTAELHDTWVITGPPEEQKVPWTFISPSGKQHTVFAEYTGEHRWKVQFLPDELGRWQYKWTQNFDHLPYESAIGKFDVIAATQKNAKRALQDLINRVRSSDLLPGIQRTEIFGPAFYRLERELMRLGPTGSSSTKNSFFTDNEIPKLLDQARESISGERPERPRIPSDD